MKSLEICEKQSFESRQCSIFDTFPLLFLWYFAILLISPNCTGTTTLYPYQVLLISLNFTFIINCTCHSIFIMSSNSNVNTELKWYHKILLVLPFTNTGTMILPMLQQSMIFSISTATAIAWCIESYRIPRYIDCLLYTSDAADE